MPEKGARPDRPDLVVLPRDPALGQVQPIGPVQASIIVVPDFWFGQHRFHPTSIIGYQRCGTHHSGEPQQHGAVQPPQTGHTHQGEEGN